MRFDEIKTFRSPGKTVCGEKPTQDINSNILVDDPENKAGATMQWFGSEHIHVLERISQSLDLFPLKICDKTWIFLFADARRPIWEIRWEKRLKSWKADRAIPRDVRRKVFDSVINELVHVMHQLLVLPPNYPQLCVDLPQKIDHYSWLWRDKIRKRSKITNAFRRHQQMTIC